MCVCIGDRPSDPADSYLKRILCLFGALAITEAKHTGLGGGQALG